MLQGGKDVYDFLSSTPRFDNRNGNEGDDFNSGFSVLSESRNVAGCLMQKWSSVMFFLNNG